MFILSVYIIYVKKKRNQQKVAKRTNIGAVVSGFPIQRLGLIKHSLRFLMQYSLLHSL